MSSSEKTRVARLRNGRQSSLDEEAGIRPSEPGHETLLLSPPSEFYHRHFPDGNSLRQFRDRFMRKGKRKIGVLESLRAIALSSWMNILLILVPIAWVSHFKSESEPQDSEEERKARWSPTITFVLCFLSIIPLERLFDYSGEQMEYYCGKDLGDLIVVTLNNAVEATLAIILLIRCELKLLQSTIVGVVVLHLLLIPGTAFITGGVRILEQELHPHLTELNHSLLTIGVLSLLLPAAFFAALDRGTSASFATMEAASEGIVNDTTRTTMLQMSRGLAVILLAVYLCSRIFLHNPPGENNSLSQVPKAPEALIHKEAELKESDPKVNQFVCIIMILVCIALMGTTAEWLVESIEFVREGKMEEEWFGLILLPIVSFAADGTVAIIFFLRSTANHFFQHPLPPATLAKGRAIDLSIQFTLFWMPFIVLLGWWTNKPMSMLFDFFEVAIIIGACFIVNYVTADAKTNWAEGFAMVAFYLMIALCAWFYPGQPEINLLLACPESVEAAIAQATSGDFGPSEF